MTVLFSTSTFVQQAVFQTASSELVFVLKDLLVTYGGADPGPGVPLGADNSTTVAAITSRTVNGRKEVQIISETEAAALIAQAGRMVFESVRTV